MKFTIEPNILKSSLDKCGAVLLRSASLPVMSCVLIEANMEEIKFTACNENTRYSCSVEDASVSKSGRIAVSHKFLSTLITPASSLVVLEVVEKELVVMFGKTRAKIPLAVEAEFPTHLMESCDKMQEVDAMEFKKALKTVAPVVSDEVADTVMNMACLRGKEFIGLNRRALFIVEGLEFEGEFSIRQDSIGSILRILPDSGKLEIGGTQNHISIRGSGFEFSTMKLQADFIPNKRLDHLRSYDKTPMVFNREELLSSLKQFLGYTADGFITVEFHVSQKKAILCGAKSDTVDLFTEVQCETKMETVFAVNPNFVIEALQSFSGEEAKMFVNSDKTPSLLVLEAENFYCALATMRTSATNKASNP